MRSANKVAVMCLAGAIALSSCVSKKKYVAATKANDALRTENRVLTDQLSEANTSINDLEEQVKTLSAYYNSANAKLNLTEEQIREQQKKLRHLQDLIYAQHESTMALKKKIAQALVNFNTDELTVSIKDGKVYVSMQENLLFPSGSAKVNSGGKEALAKLAAVLNQNPDINVEVEGHTDDKPINTAKFQDNWALSVGRSTAIARILIDDYSVDPTSITASGHSKYSPVADNSSADGRSQNRRTEIILEPELDELMELIHDVPEVAKK